MFTNVSTHECMSGHQTLGNFRYIPTRVLEKRGKDHLISCGWVLSFTCKSVLNMLIMGLAPKHGLMVVSTAGIL